MATRNFAEKFISPKNLFRRKIISLKNHFTKNSFHLKIFSPKIPISPINPHFADKSHFAEKTKNRISLKKIAIPFIKVIFFENYKKKSKKFLKITLVNRFFFSAKWEFLVK